MALTWEFKCSEEEHADRRRQYPPTPDGNMNSVTYWLIMSTMNTRVHDLTTLKGRDEAFRRIAFYETLLGAVCQTAEGPRPITRHDVEVHRGLLTNAFPQDTWRKFTSNLVDHWRAENDRQTHMACRHYSPEEGGFCTEAYDGVYVK